MKEMIKKTSFPTCNLTKKHMPMPADNNGIGFTFTFTWQFLFYIVLVVAASLQAFYPHSLFC